MFFSLKTPANFTRSRDFCTHKNTIVNPTHQKQIEQITSKCTGMQLLCVNSWYHNLPFVPWHCGFDRAFGSFGKQLTERVNLWSMFFFFNDDPMFSFLRHPKHPMHSGRVTLSHTKQETAFLAMIQLILTSTTWAILDFGNQQFHRTPWISMAADLQATASGWNNFFKPTETAIFKIICLVAQFYC